MAYPRRGRARFVARSRNRLILSGSKTLVLTQPTETDLAQQVRPQRPRAVGQTTSAHTTFAIRPGRVISIGQAQETDQANGLTAGSHPVGQVLESDLAQTVRAGHLIHPGMPTETDTTFSVRPAHRRILGQPVDTQTAQSVRPQKQRILGVVIATNIAQPIRIGPMRVNRAFETDTANQVLPIKAIAKRINIGQATAEGDVTFEMCPQGGRNIRPVTLTLFHE